MDRQHRDLYNHVDRLLHVRLRYLLAGATHDGYTVEQIAADLSWLLAITVPPAAVESWLADLGTGAPSSVCAAGSAPDPSGAEPKLPA